MRGRKHLYQVLTNCVQVFSKPSSANKVWQGGKWSFCCLLFVCFGFALIFQWLTTTFVASFLCNLSPQIIDLNAHFDKLMPRLYNWWQRFPFVLKESFESVLTEFLAQFLSGLATLEKWEATEVLMSPRKGSHNPQPPPRLSIIGFIIDRTLLVSLPIHKKLSIKRLWVCSLTTRWQFEAIFNFFLS